MKLFALIIYFVARSGQSLNNGHLWSPNIESVLKYTLHDLGKELRKNPNTSSINVDHPLKLDADVRVQVFGDQTLRVKLDHILFYSNGSQIRPEKAHQIIHDERLHEVGTHHTAQTFNNFLETPFLIHMKQHLVKNLLVSKNEPFEVTEVKKLLASDLEKNKHQVNLQLVMKKAIAIPMETPKFPMNVDLGVKFGIPGETRLCDPALGELNNPSCKSGEYCWKPFGKDYGFCEEEGNYPSAGTGAHKMSGGVTSGMRGIDVLETERAASGMRDGYGSTPESSVRGIEDSTGGKVCLTRLGKHNNPMCNDGEICVWLLDPKQNWNPIEQCIKANVVNKGIIKNCVDVSKNCKGNANLRNCVFGVNADVQHNCKKSCGQCGTWKENESGSGSSPIWGNDKCKLLWGQRQSAIHSNIATCKAYCSYDTLRHGDDGCNAVNWNPATGSCITFFCPTPITFPKHRLSGWKSYYRD